MLTTASLASVRLCVLAGPVRVANAGHARETSSFDVRRGVADERTCTGLRAQGGQSLLDQVWAGLEERRVMAGARHH